MASLASSGARLALTLLFFAVADIAALPTGAPTAACSTLTPRHFTGAGEDGFAVQTPCGPSCPFSLALTEIDGQPPPPGPLRYRCGSLHTIRVQTSDPTFRGLVVQSREPTSEFDPSANFVGSFTNAPAGADWRIWSCDAPSATHTNRNDKTAVDLTWQAPGMPSTTNITLWFSVVRMFPLFHTQLRGLDLAPEPVFCIPAPEPVALFFINDSPTVSGNSISADIQIIGTPQTVLCALTNLPYQDCSSGSVTFTNVPVFENMRPYILRVAANTTDGLRTVIRRAVRLELPEICTVHLINDGVTVFGDSATVEFASTGPTTSFVCSLDRQAFTPCSSGQTFTGLTPGEHRLKISPADCGRNRRPITTRFTVVTPPS